MKRLPLYQTSLVEGEWVGVGGRLGDGLKRNDEGRSDCIDCMNCPGLSYEVSDGF